MAYQDTWIGGRAVRQGDRPCAARYDAIRSVVGAYRRTVTVWDIGANLGYFGLRLAHDFDAVSIMVDSRPGLIDVLRENNAPTTVGLTHRLSARDLAEISASEHADVVLALNVLHHMVDWREALEAILTLGERVIIETPGRGDTASANYDASQQLLGVLEGLGGCRLLATALSHVTPGVRRPTFLIERPKRAVSAGYAYIDRVRRRGAHTPRAHSISSNLNDKAITYAGGEVRPWVHGLNLWNWAQLGGAFPARRRVRTAVQTAWDALDEPHGDFRPWNLILSGQTVSAIDGGHRTSVDDRKGLRDTLAWIDDPREAYATCA